MKSFLILLLLAVTVASAAKTHSKRETLTASLNDYVDKVIGNLQTFLQENSYDSIALPNVTQSFSVKPLLITYSGRLSLYDGILSNLDSVKRFGDVTLSYGDKIFGFSANLGIDSAVVNYVYGSKLLGISASGAVAGSAAAVDIGLNIEANLPEYKLSLNSFGINSIGKVSAKLSGNILTDWLANVIVRIVISIIKDNVTNDLDNAVTNIIENGLEGINEYLAALPKNQ